MNTITDVEAMAPYELLHDARRLLAGGDVIPAAVMARAALDTWMRGRVALLGRQRRYVGLRCYTDVLRHYGAISRLTRRLPCGDCYGSDPARHTTTRPWHATWKR